VGVKTFETQFTNRLQNHGFGLTSTTTLDLLNEQVGYVGKLAKLVDKVEFTEKCSFGFCLPVAHLRRVTVRSSRTLVLCLAYL
jgi:hypothetical protein